MTSNSHGIPQPDGNHLLLEIGSEPWALVCRASAVLGRCWLFGRRGSSVREGCRSSWRPLGLAAFEGVQWGHCLTASETL